MKFGFRQAVQGLTCLRIYHPSLPNTSHLFAPQPIYTRHTNLQGPSTFHAKVVKSLLLLLQRKVTIAYHAERSEASLRRLYEALVEKYCVLRNYTSN